MAFDFARAVELHQLTLEVGNRQDSTRYWYRLVLGRFQDYLHTQLPADTPLTLTHLTLEHARSFLLYVRDMKTIAPLSGAERGHGPSTIARHVRALKSFATFLVDEELLTADPLRKLRPPKVTVPLIGTFTPAHIDAMVRIIERQHQRTRNLAILCVLLDTGARADELCRLQRADVDLRERTARILGKGSKWRVLHFGPATVRALTYYLAERGQDERSELFLGYRGRPMNRGSLYKLVTDWGERAGISEQVRCSPHTFRHTMACCFLRAHPGALLHLQALLGHSDLNMVRRYARLAETDLHLDGPTPVDQLGLTKLIGGRPRR